MVSFFSAEQQWVLNFKIFICVYLCQSVSYFSKISELVIQPAIADAAAVAGLIK